MDIASKKILVTGADGFIGSHLTEELLRRGCSVRALVCYNSWGSWGCLDNLPKAARDQIEFAPGDIRDPHGVKEAMKGCDVVMHLAALVAIPFSYTSPGSYIETNIKGTLNILQAARELGVEKIVQTSTSEVYGTARFVPITEEHPLQGQSPYSASKIGADHLALSFYYSFKTPVTVIRPFNTYGPRQSARAVIPTIIVQLASGRKKIKLGALHPTRDFSYVYDTVRGFIALAESDSSVGEVINIGSNYEISIAETARLIADVMGVEAEIEADHARIRPEKSEVERLWCDNSKARRLTGWEPLYAGRDGLVRGLRETIDWFVEKNNFRNYQDRATTYNI
ncbi:MAG TPA: NAD-dependent 4,6-dehydratase LegB [Candidatus Obscuribacterales bacterium]